MTSANERPERDPQLDAAWKTQSDEMPSAQLDAGILAAAHRAVASAPEIAGSQSGAGETVSTSSHAAGRTQRQRMRAESVSTPPHAARRAQRWGIPMAAAATLSVVTLGFLLTRPQQPDMTAPNMPAPDMPARNVTAPNMPARSNDASAPTAARDLQGKPAGPVQPAPPALPEVPAPTVAPPAEALVAARKAAAAPPSVEREAARIAASPSSARAAAQGSARERRETSQGTSTPALAFAPAPASAPAGEIASATSQPPTPATTANALLEKKESATDADSGKPLDAKPLDAKPFEAKPFEAKPFDVDASIARISSLHSEGKLAAAANELNMLRAAVPDADQRLPSKLRAWATSVKP